MPRDPVFRELRYGWDVIFYLGEPEFPPTLNHVFGNLWFNIYRDAPSLPEGKRLTLLPRADDWGTASELC